MGSLRVALTAGAVASVAVLLAAGGAGAQSPTLFGVVGPGFSIKLSDAAGDPVKTLQPGTYTIQVQDNAEVHNFHLTGPGVDMATDVEQTGTFTWTVTFSAGTYHFQCDPHASTMFGTFTVGVAPPTTTTTPPPAKPTPTRLVGSVGPGKRISLTRSGARFVSVKSGPAVVVVTDRSATDNFHLIGPGVNRATTKAGKKTVTWRVTFRRGRYAFRSDATRTLRGSFRVT
jgi:plastocyanin